ncbi:MAG: hypothetical protein WC546_03630 [Candidatus Omnitrophota bacterium]
MEKIKHPNKEEICNYIWEELSEEREIEIGEHLAMCEKCVDFSREIYRTKFFWQGWTAKLHGEVFWQERIKETLASALQARQTPAIKARLQAWLKNWKGKVGGAVSVILEDTRQLGRVITEFPQEILAPRALQFIPVAAVRGVESQAEIKIISKGDLDVSIIVDTKNKKVLVRIKEGKSIAPLVMLSPRSGKPFLAEPKKIAGTNFYAASFENIPEGEYTLIFEPEAK